MENEKLGNPFQGLCLQKICEMGEKWMYILWGNFSDLVFATPVGEKVVLRVEVIRGMFTPALSTEGQRSPSCRLEQQGHSPKTRALNSFSSLPAHYLSAQQKESSLLIWLFGLAVMLIWIDLRWIFVNSEIFEAPISRFLGLLMRKKQKRIVHLVSIKKFLGFEFLS